MAEPWCATCPRPPDRRRAASPPGGAAPRRAGRGALGRSVRHDAALVDGETLLRLIGSPNIGSRRSIFRRYDHQVGDDTVILPGGDAALLRVRGTAGAIALTTDGNARYGALDRAGCRHRRLRSRPQRGRRRSHAGRGDELPQLRQSEKPEVFWQLSESVEGMREACLALGVPVVSGNVSSTTTPRE